MNALPRWRRPGRIARRAALTLGLAGTALALGLGGTSLAGSRLATSHVRWPIAVNYAAAAWGEGSCGELGNGTTNFSAQWVGVSGLGGGVAQVAAGSCHSLAVRSDGTAWAWGNNLWGQLGNGTTVGSSVPVQVTGLTGVTQVTAGYSHSLALRSDGTVWAWGGNGAGQLGNGTTANSGVPVRVTGLTGVVKISAGADFSLALRSDGTVWAWGNNGAGQLGNGTTAFSSVPVQVYGLSRVTNISAGWNASLATRTNGITAISQVWAWGDNSEGELGDGTLTNHLIPEQVTGIGTPFIAGIAAGEECALVLGTDGSVWGWGDNVFGLLGSPPSNTPVTQPVLAMGAGSGFTQLSAGGTFVLALRSDGTAWTWGNNHDGQLGDGTMTDSTAPVQVTGLTNVTQVAAGSQHALAVHTVPWVIFAQQH